MKNLLILLLSRGKKIKELSKILTICPEDGRLIIDENEFLALFNFDNQDSLYNNEEFQNLLYSTCGNPGIICVYKNKGVNGETPKEIFICGDSTHGKYVGMSWNLEKIL